MLKVAKELAEGSDLLLFRVLVIPQKLLHAFAHDLLLRGLVVQLVHSSTCVWLEISDVCRPVREGSKGMRG